jgi:hypothetical protein
MSYGDDNPVLRELLRQIREREGERAAEAFRAELEAAAGTPMDREIGIIGWADRVGKNTAATGSLLTPKS